MNVSVLIAYRDLGEISRRASFDWVYAYWRAVLPDAEIVVNSTAEPFTKASGLNAAAREASGDVFLHSDPDSFVWPGRALAALELASESDGLVVPFDSYVYLSPRPTARVLATDVRIGALIASGDAYFAEQSGDDDFAEASGPGGVGNVTAYSRRTWEEIGGYDERFGLWGGDDGAFAYSAGALVAPLRRLFGPVYHLWHPRLPASIPGDREYLRQFSILEEYRDAAENPDAIRSIINRRKEADAS